MQRPGTAATPLDTSCAGQPGRLACRFVLHNGNSSNDKWYRWVRRAAEVLHMFLSFGHTLEGLARKTLHYQAALHSKS